MVIQQGHTEPELKQFLDSRISLYNTRSFIATDPISIPHAFTVKEDIEIAGFLTAILSWGRRSMIINKAGQLMNLMENDPYAFLTRSGEHEFSRFLGYIYRTFQGEDALFFVSSLRLLYLEHGGLDQVFTEGYHRGGNTREAIVFFRRHFFRNEHLGRSEKHLPDPSKGSAAKRLNMYLRWMVRQDSSGVDFGIWKTIPASALMCPLDVHSGRVARKLGLLKRRQDDWLAVEELTSKLRKFDPSDPVKYDFALFGLGIYEHF